MVKRTEYLWLDTVETKKEMIDKGSEYLVLFGLSLDIS